MTAPDLIGLFIEPLEGTQIPYMITGGVASGSDRHLRDVAMMLRISGDVIDAEELDRWLSEMELGDAFRTAWGYEGE